MEGGKDGRRKKGWMGGGRKKGMMGRGREGRREKLINEIRDEARKSEEFCPEMDVWLND